jgi:pSer/pThr/pTyr-binding forkhead associated (FHA) protein
MDQSPITRDLAVATRDLALAIVSEAIAAAGTDTTARVRVVEGVDQGSILALSRFGHEYVIGRAPDCDLSLTDPDVSREHIRVVRLNDGVVVVDAGTKNGTSIGAARVGPRERTVWRPAQMIHIGRTVLSLEEPLNEALARIESSPDDPVEPGDFATGPGQSGRGFGSPAGDEAARARDSDGHSPVAALDVGEPGPTRPDGSDLAGTPEKSQPPTRGATGRAGRPRWSVTDIAVMTAAVGVLVASLVGLVWLLRG